MARNASRDRSLPVTTTRSPSDRAIGTAICPKLPDPPGMSNLCPDCTCSSSTSPCQAVRPVSGMAAATSNAYPAGIFATTCSLTATYSAKAPIRSSGRRV